METVAIISFTDLSSDSRVYRQIMFLKEHYRVIAIGMGDPHIDGIRYIHISPQPKTFAQKLKGAALLLTRRYEAYYWKSKRMRENKKKLEWLHADTIIANEIDALPLAIELSNHAKVILDAHEYSPREFEDSIVWRMFYKGYKQYLCESYIKRADRMMTVCDGIAQEYERHFHVKPAIITNAPDYEEIQPNPTAGKIRLIHHGLANASRKIENMIEAMDHLDERFELNLMLVSDGTGYMNKIKKMAMSRNNVRVLEPVPMRDITRYISRFDIGIFLLEPTNFNYRMALPNKFFEFIQARLAIAIGPSPEMEKIVRTYDCGVIAEDFSPEAMAECLMKLNPDVLDHYKAKSHEIAEMMSSRKNRDVIHQLVSGGTELCVELPQ